MARTAEFTKTLSIALPEVTYHNIKKISDLEGCSMGSVFREIVKQHFENETYEPTKQSEDERQTS